MPFKLTSMPRLPTWARWVTSFGVAAALLVALVLFVSHQNPAALAPANPAAEVRANREAEILVAQDQAPRVASAAGVAARAALARAVRADMTARIDGGQISGPLARIVCARAGSATAFSCTATAADVNYDYVGVVDPRARRLTYCRRDPPPVPSQNVPVSPRCTA
ncbi:MAG: hypothetical protein ABSH51_20935 [Solirubrobacteraceae bacterium]